ncbi:MAG: hypothetical protein PHC90_12825 [Syntrophorhabdaceae bacterium]|nr:hypothetical protein [Syntrophorhabdaceae bacterium]
MKANFIERYAGIVFVLILLSSVLPCIVNGKNLFTSVDEIACSDVVAKVFTKCPPEDNIIPLSECARQHFLFLNKATGTSVEVECSGKNVAHFGPDGRSMGNYLDALAVSWACVRGTKGSYHLLVTYQSGGTQGEWVEIYSLEGRRLAGERARYDQTDIEKDRQIDKFEDTYRHLGLPAQWPSDAFRYIRLFKVNRDR